MVVKRPTTDEWGLQIAEVVATRATCRRRLVGAVLLDRRGHILSTGYNGPAMGMPHCGDAQDGRSSHLACQGAEMPSGTGLDVCQAIHAEQNALLQCRDVGAVYTCCVTVSPCVACVKMLMNTGCQRVVFREEYSAEHASAAREWWTAFYAREWIYLPRQA
jgi:dCMP deaminase